MTRHLPLVLTLLGCLSAPKPGNAGSVSLAVTDAAGRPVPDAVALLEPVGARAAVKPLPDTEIAQRQRQFIPRVTVITTGTRVNFPNFDTVRHHVYSFSSIKPFELKLYAGVPGTPVVFDKPGVAVIGCNIHDKMAGWIVVADTPWFARTGTDGRGTLPAVPAGPYRLSVWHAALPATPRAAAVDFTVTSADQQHAVQLPVDVQP